MRFMRQQHDGPDKSDPKWRHFLRPQQFSLHSDNMYEVRRYRINHIINKLWKFHQHTCNIQDVLSNNIGKKLFLISL
jgi:hypothetical protein